MTLFLINFMSKPFEILISKCNIDIIIIRNLAIKVEPERRKEAENSTALSSRDVFNGRPGSSSRRRNPEESRASHWDRMQEYAATIPGTHSSGVCSRG